MWSGAKIPNQQGRIMLITGANSGVGFESSLVLAQKGAQILMACRSQTKGEQARQAILQRVPNAKLDLLILNLGDLASIEQLAQEVNNRYPRLDILLNNAGIMQPPYGQTNDGFELQFGTNHLGHFALTGRLLPKLLATPNSRVITVSSAAYLSGVINFDDLQSKHHYDSMKAYKQSKLANILFAQELQRQLSVAHATTISISSQPGWVFSNLQARPDSRVHRFFMATVRQSAQQGALSQLYAATASGVQGGEFYEPRWVLRGNPVQRNLIERGRNTATAQRLWQISEQLTGVHYQWS